MKFKHLTINCQLSIVNCQLFSYSIILLLFFASPLKAQVTIGSQDPPHSFSVLELITKNHDSGLRLPLLSTDERDNLKLKDLVDPEAQAAKGLVIYNTTTNCLEFWNGNDWISMCSDVLPPPPTLEVTPSELFFEYNVTAGKNVTVTTNQTSWSFSVSGANWEDYFDVSKSNNTLTVSPKTNNSSTTTPRTATITVTAGSLTETVTVIQSVNPAIIPGSGTMIISNLSYVGAFWKHNERGERIIRITGIASAAAGNWTASATWYDSNWNPDNGDGIVFSAAPTSDPGVTFAAGENPGDAESWQVTDGSNFISGDVAAGGNIEFRIGLQQRFTAYKPDNNPTPNPARYAVVLISYNNNTKVQKIFIRQGEGADYLPGSNNQGKRWSPYNLGNYGDPSLYNNGGFVAYPTQAGYLYQWGYSPSDNTPLPYPPVGTTLSPTWLSDYDNALPTLGSVCPSGYTMPTAGSAGTDMSYFPPQDSTAWGYYADGFFDRRQIVSSPTGTASSTVSYNASILADNVAYIGKLFYNSTTNASLFMPAAGYRYDSDGTLSSTGSSGYYWSSTQHDSTYAYLLGFNSSLVSPASSYTRANGFSVRCVEE